MALRPYEDIIGPLIIPVRGKEYTLPPISLADGLRMHAAASRGEEISLKDLNDIILGETKDAMLADGVPPSVIDRAFWVGLTDFQQGREAAEQIWEHGVPKAVLEELVKAFQNTTPPAADSTTPPPASGSTTNPTRAKAPRSRGNKSSPTGP